MKKKIIIIIIAAVVLAAGILAFTLTGKPDGTSETENYQATYKMADENTVNLTIKGDFPENSCWHVTNMESDDEDQQVISYNVDKISKSQVKMTLSGKNEGMGTLFIYADQNPKGAVNAPEGSEATATDDSKEASEEESEIEVSLAVYMEVGPEMDCFVNGFMLSESLKKELLSEDLPTPLYLISHGNALEIEIPEGVEGWSTSDFDKEIVNVEGVFYDETGGHISITPLKAGDTKLTLFNKYYNTQAVLDLQVSGETETSMIIKAVSCKVSQPQVEEGEEDTQAILLAELSDVLDQVPLPEGAYIETIKPLKYDKEGFQGKEGSDYASIEVNYNGKSYFYLVSKKVAMNDMVSGMSEALKDRKPEKKVEDIGDLKLRGFVCEGLVSGYWTYEGINCVLTCNEGEWEDITSFVSALGLVAVPEKTGSSQSGTDSEDEDSDKPYGGKLTEEQQKLADRNDLSEDELLELFNSFETEEQLEAFLEGHEIDVDALVDKLKES